MAPARLYLSWVLPKQNLKPVLIREVIPEAAVRGQRQGRREANKGGLSRSLPEATGAPFLRNLK